MGYRGWGMPIYIFNLSPWWGGDGFRPLKHVAYSLDCPLDFYQNKVVCGPPSSDVAFQFTIFVTLHYKPWRSSGGAEKPPAQEPDHLHQDQYHKITLQVRHHFPLSSTMDTAKVDYAWQSSSRGPGKSWWSWKTPLTQYRLALCVFRTFFLGGGNQVHSFAVAFGSCLLYNRWPYRIQHIQINIIHFVQMILQHTEPVFVQSHNIKSISIINSPQRVKGSSQHLSSESACTFVQNLPKHKCFFF